MAWSKRAWGAEERSMTLKRLLVVTSGSLGCVVLMYATLVVASPAAEMPAALVCDRGRANVEISTTAIGGHFEEYRVGPCVAYTHNSRAVGGD